jgi:iron complex outermembrane recepter protein
MIARSHFGALVATAIVSSLAASPALAQAQVNFNLPAQGLAKSLKDVARATNTNVVFEPARIEGKQAPALKGMFTAKGAIARLIAGQSLEARSTGSGTWVVSAVGNGAAGAESAPPLGEGPPTQSSAANRGSTEIVVTGTRIRGGRTPSPVIVIGSKQIQEEGFNDLGEVVRSIPQNFSGGQNPGVSTGNISGAGLANQNLTGGSALNLRGLGPDATLTLLNGRRLAYGGFVQSVDISAIPVEAVDRIEIVPDGASAIYGSDAVGGVANVILKRDFQGLTVGGRIGGATDGGLGTREFTGTAGTSWSSGGFIATYENSSTDPIYARQRSYADFLVDPTTLYPGSNLRSGLVNAHQQLGDAISVHLDGLRTRRDQDYSYYFSGMNNIHAKSTATLVSPSVDFSLPAGWSVTIGGAWGKNDLLQHQIKIDDITDATTVIDNTLYRNESRTFDAGAEGPLFALPGGDARLAIGGSYRTNDFEQFNRTTDTAIVQGRERTKSAYVEVSLPVIGPQTKIGWVRRLILTAAVRREDYDGFGSIATPKFGIVYDPNTEMTFKASWGKSFKAPTLLQRFQARYAYLFSPGSFGGTGYPAGATVIVNAGGNPDLKPEKAKTLTATLAFHPTTAPAFQAELTGFYIDYADRVVQPIANASQALSNPVYAQFIDYSPTIAQQANILASASSFYNFSGAAYDPAQVAAIINLQYLNVARQKIRGLDLSGSYWLKFGTGRMTIRGSASWLDSTQQAGAAQAAYQLAGTLFNPPKLSARLGAVWDRRGLSAAVFVNYKGGVRDLVRQETTASFTTVDAVLRYTTSGHGALSGLSLALSAQNLFDRAPPLYTPTSYAAYAVPYDSTNYSAIGRFVSLSVSKHF